MKTRFLLVVLLSSVCLYCLPQGNKGKLIITGVVLDVSGQPVSNAFVMVDGQKTNTFTNDKGEYRIKVSAEAKSIGILTFNNGLIGEDIEGRNVINFRFGSAAMNTSEGPVDEAVNTGYGSVRRKDLATDIDKIDGTDKKFKSYSDIYEMIQRECSGVSVNGGSIIIQDSRNLNGPVPPLFVVDGAYVNSISQIKPSMVESIQVLKGTSAAIYGSRGYGGAIVITTRKE